MTRRSRQSVRLAAIVLALVAAGACTSPDSPDPGPPATSDPTSSTTSDPPATASPDDVRAALGALDPCALLTTGDDPVRAAFAEGPHTCEGDLAGGRVTVEVGVPFAEDARGEAEAVSGLAAYVADDRCRTVFPVGASHGVAVSALQGCAGLDEGTSLVGDALAGGADDLRRPAGPDNLDACRLMAGAVDDPTVLVDAAGEMTQGLDHCEVGTEPATARTRLTLGDTQMPFDRMAQLLKGERLTVAGQDAVTTTSGPGACYLHTYLWSTELEGRGRVDTEATIAAASCGEARDVAVAVIGAAAEEPAAPGSVADLLVPAP